MANYRNDTSYVKKRDALRRQAKKNNTPCALCHKPIDFTLHYTHPMSFTADHIKAVATGGSMTGALQPAHRSCNSRKSDKPTYRTIAQPNPSRDW